MRWPDEVRDPVAVDPPNEKVSEEEIEGALAVIDGMTRDDLECPGLTDAYTEAMAKFIGATGEDKPLLEPPGPGQPGQVPGPSWPP